MERMGRYPFHVIKELTQGVLKAVAKERERLTKSKPVSGCVNMLENRPFENVGCALGSRRCENAALQGE